MIELEFGMMKLLLHLTIEAWWKAGVVMGGDWLAGRHGGKGDIDHGGQGRWWVGWEASSENLGSVAMCSMMIVGAGGARCSKVAWCRWVSGVVVDRERPVQ
jgi:hypothetical protein